MEPAPLPREVIACPPTFALLLQDENVQKDLSVDSGGSALFSWSDPQGLVGIFVPAHPGPTVLEALGHGGNSRLRHADRSRLGNSLHQAIQVGYRLYRTRGMTTPVC